MANPQPDKYTRISNELLEHLCSIRIPGEAMQILLVIFRKTYGYNKKSDKISLTYFSQFTSIPTSNCSRAIKKLENMNVINVKRDKYISEYSIQKDYDKWQILSKMIVPTTTIQKDSKDTINIDSHTIQSDSKTTIPKDRYKRKKENLKESKESSTSLTSQKNTSEYIRELFINNSKIQYPSPKNHISPILKILESIPPELTKDDIAVCLHSTFSKLKKDKGVYMAFLLENIRKSISAKHENILLQKKQLQLKQSEIDRINCINAKKQNQIEEAKEFRKQTAEKIIKYTEFFQKNKSLFSTMEKYEIEKAFKNNSFMLVENIFITKMSNSKKTLQ